MVPKFVSISLDEKIYEQMTYIMVEQREEVEKIERYVRKLKEISNKIQEEKLKKMAKK